MLRETHLNLYCLNHNWNKFEVVELYIQFLIMHKNWKYFVNYKLICLNLTMYNLTKNLISNNLISSSFKIDKNMTIFKAYEKSVVSDLKTLN